MAIVLPWWGGAAQAPQAHQQQPAENLISVTYDDGTKEDRAIDGKPLPDNVKKVSAISIRTPEQVDLLLSSLALTHRLEGISIQSNTGATDGQLLKIALIAKQNPNLSYLNLSFYGKGTTPKGCVDLLEIIKECSRLGCVTLYFTGCEKIISEYDFAKLTRANSVYLRTLQEHEKATQERDAIKLHMNAIANRYRNGDMGDNDLN